MNKQDYKDAAKELEQHKEDFKKAVTGRVIGKTLNTLILLAYIIATTEIIVSSLQGYKNELLKPIAQRPIVYHVKPQLLIENL